MLIQKLGCYIFLVTKPQKPLATPTSLNVFVLKTPKENESISYHIYIMIIYFLSSQNKVEWDK